MKKIFAFATFVMLLLISTDISAQRVKLPIEQDEGPKARTILPKEDYKDEYILQPKYAGDWQGPAFYDGTTGIVYDAVPRPDLTNYTKQEVSIGRHQFKPAPITLYKHRQLQSLSYDIVFDESCMYDMEGDMDQLDWNKGLGVSLDWKRNDKDAIMWAWRANPDSNRMELTLYAHKKYKRIVGYNGNEVLLTAKPYEKVSIEINRMDREEWEMTFVNHDQGTINQAIVKMRKNPCYSRRINAWFGGANNAPGPYGGLAPDYMFFYVNYDSKY